MWISFLLGVVMGVVLTMAFITYVVRLLINENKDD